MIYLPGELSAETLETMRARLERHEEGKAIAARAKALPAKPAQAFVAWDLTLRCPACHSNVEGNVREYHCFTCERKGR